MFYNVLQVFDEWLAEHGSYSLLQVLYQLEFRSFAAVVLGFVLVFLGGKPTIRWLRRQKLGDAPEFYREDVNALMAGKHATPTMGGLYRPRRISSWRLAQSAVLTSIRCCAASPVTKPRPRRAARSSICARIGWGTGSAAQ